MPGKETYDELIEVSYTVTFNKQDISQLCYDTVCNEIIEKYFDQAIAQSQGQSAGPWVAKAESIALAKNDPPSFERWLKEAIRISDAHRNLENQVMRTRAEWLLEVMDDLF